MIATDHEVASPDGTHISCSVKGSGPPLVLVHGTSNNRSSFRFVEPLLRGGHTVVAVDRRGRAPSGDGQAAYRIGHEFADVAAVVDSLGEPADLFGHSFGATVALGAAPLARNLRRLMLYEGAPGIPVASPSFLTHLDQLASEERGDQLLSEFLAEVGMSPDDLEELRASPLWASRVAAAHTIPREIRAEEGYIPDANDFGGVTAPTMLLVGTESPDWAASGTEFVASLLPDHRILSLEGQGHLATLTAPELLAAEIVRFLGS